MDMAERRQIAIGAVRSEFRRKGVSPKQAVDTAFAVLDDLCRAEPKLVACQWYMRASQRQLKLFKVDWYVQQHFPEQAAWR